MNSQERRRERRAQKQLQWKADNPLQVGINAKPGRTVFLLNRNVDRVGKALIAQDTPYYDSANNCCMSETAQYAAGYRRQRKGVTHITK